jgi:hypothetical protein
MTDAASRHSQRRLLPCRCFENYPQTIHNNPLLNLDFFYQEHLKSGHFAICEPLMAPHEAALPEEPPLRAEVPFSLMTRRLRPVKLQDKLLSSRHIRLVKLLPPSDSDDLQRDLPRFNPGDLHCEVFQVSLDSISSDGRPMFAALSYACGEPIRTHRVRCGQTHIPITQNLFDALLHVRHDNRPRLLWADGLCIDQENTEEKNHQVGMLHQIYSQAPCRSLAGHWRSMRCHSPR